MHARSQDPVGVGTDTAEQGIPLRAGSAGKGYEFNQAWKVEGVIVSRDFGVAQSERASVGLIFCATVRRASTSALLRECNINRSDDLETR